ncbi:VOC family protein [bacterium]|nr:VOC family protein [bacterium]
MSLPINPVGWFEIPVNDLLRAKGFYEAAFGIEIQIMDMGPKQMGWFPAEKGGPNAKGSLSECEGYVPSHEGTLIYFGVEKIDSTLEAIAKAGGKTLAERSSIGEYGFIAEFEDSEGNRVALHEMP